MAKSTGNVYTIADIEERGFDPLAFRYLCSMTHYRARLNFTWPALRAAQTGLERLRLKLEEAPGRATKKARAECDALRGRFWEAAAADLNVPRAMAVAWQAARSRLPGALKRELLLGFDAFLGLDLGAAQGPAVLPASIRNRVSKRGQLRRAGRYAEADAIRA